MQSNRVITDEEAYIMVGKVKYGLKSTEKLLVCAMQTEGWDIADVFEESGALKYHRLFPGRNYFRVNLRKERDDPYIYDNPKNQNRDQAYSKIVFPDELPNANVAACVDDWAHSWKSKAGYVLGAIQRGYLPKVVVVRDKSGVCDDCIYQFYEPEERMDAEAYLQQFLRNTYNQLSNKELELLRKAKSRFFVVPQPINRRFQIPSILPPRRGVLVGR